MPDATPSTVADPAATSRTTPAAPEAPRPLTFSTSPSPPQPRKLEHLDAQKTHEASSAEQPASNTSIAPDTEPVEGPASGTAAQPREVEQSHLSEIPDATHNTVAEPVATSRTVPVASETSMDLNIEATNPPRPTDITTVKGPASSNATQAPEVEEPQQAEISQALSLAIPTASTPLYTALLEKLANTDDESIMDSLASICLFGDLKYKPPAVSAEQPDRDPTSPYDLAMRVECLLGKTKAQRDLHIARIDQRNDPRLRAREPLIFHEEDKK